MEQDVKVTPAQVLGSRYGLEGSQITIDVATTGFEFRSNDIDPQNGDFSYLMYVLLETMFQAYRQVPQVDRTVNLEFRKDYPLGVEVDQQRQGYRVNVNLDQNPAQLNPAREIEQ